MPDEFAFLISARWEFHNFGPKDKKALSFLKQSCVLRKKKKSHSERISRESMQLMGRAKKHFNRKLLGIHIHNLKNTVEKMRNVNVYKSECHQYKNDS